MGRKGGRRKAGKRKEAWVKRRKERKKGGRGRREGEGLLTLLTSIQVSVTYQFLNEKIHLFSQFLFDELIKSRLYKDGITIQESHIDNTNANKTTSSDWRYPYELARYESDLSLRSFSFSFPPLPFLVSSSWSLSPSLPDFFSCGLSWKQYSFFFTQKRPSFSLPSHSSFYV
jgi:hypothetical protein